MTSEGFLLFAMPTATSRPDAGARFQVLRKHAFKSRFHFWTNRAPTWQA